MNARTIRQSPQTGVTANTTTAPDSICSPFTRTSPPPGITSQALSDTSLSSSSTGSEESAIICPTSGRLYTTVLRKNRERQQVLDQKRLTMTMTGVNASRVKKEITPLKLRIRRESTPCSSSKIEPPYFRSFLPRRTTRSAAQNSAAGENITDRWRRFWSSPLLPRPYVVLSSHHSHTHKKRIATLKRQILEIWQEHESLVDKITPPETSGKMIEVQNLLRQYEGILADVSKRYGVNIITVPVTTREISEDEESEAGSESEYDHENKPVTSIRYWTKFQRGCHGANRLVIISKESLIHSMLLLFDAAQLRSFPKTRFQVETSPYKMDRGSHGICRLPKRFVDISVLSKKQWNALLEVERWSGIQTGGVGLYLVRVKIGNSLVEAFEWQHIGESDACSKVLDRTARERVGCDNMDIDKEVGDSMEVDNLTETLQETFLRDSSSKFAEE